MKRLLIILLIFCASASYAQNKTFDYYFNKGDSLFYSNTDSAKLYYLKAIDIAKDNSNPKQELSAKINLGILYNEIGQYSEAKKTYFQCIELCSELQDTSNLINTYGNLSNTYNLLGDFDSAVFYMNKTSDLLKQINDIRRLGIVYGSLGNMYDYAEQYDQALEYYQKAMEIFRHTKDSANLSIAILNSGIIYAHINKLDTAEYYINTALKLFKRYNNTMNTARAYGTLGAIYDKRNNLPQSLEYQQKALDLYYKINNTNGIILSVFAISDILIKQGKFTNSRDSLLKIYKLATQTQSIYQLERVSFALKACYDSLGDYHNAYLWSNNYNQFHDSIFNIENTEKLKELQVKYEVEKQQHNIDNLRLRQKRFKILTFSLIIIILLATILFIMAFNRQKIKNQVKTLEIEQKMLRMQMNSHFIFNSLSIIQNFILSSDIQKANNYLSDFAKLMRNLLYFSREKLINLDDEINTLKLYIEFQKVRFNNKFDYSFVVDENIDIENTLIPPLIIQPFVENAIEHGLSKKDGHGHLEINFSTNNNLLKISILDNGIGIETSKSNKPKTKHKSLAIEITRERIKTLLPKKHRKNFFTIIDRKHENAQGTRVTFLLPLIEEF